MHHGCPLNRYSFSCLRADGISSCFDSSTFYTGSQSGAKYTFNAAFLAPPVSESNPDGLAEGERLYITVTAYKDDGRSSSATTSFQALPAGISVPDFSIARDCESTCPSRHSSSNPLPLILDLEQQDLNRTESITWEWNGQIVRGQDLAGGDPEDTNPVVNTISITLRPDILPRVGISTVTCNVTMPDSTGTSNTFSAQQSISLSGPPVCGQSQGKCLVLSTDSLELPDIKFVAQATGFSGDRPLSFEFGYLDESGDPVVLQPAARESTTQLYATEGSRNYTIYVTAISEVGGRSTISTATLELKPGGSTEELEERLSKLDFGRRSRTGDIEAVLGGFKEMNSYLNALGAFNTSSQTGRSLLQSGDTISDGLAQLQDILSNPNAGVPEALNVLASLRSTFSSQDPTEQQAKSVATIARDALELLDDSGSSTTGLSAVGGGLGSAGLAAEVLNEGGIDLQNTAATLQETMKSARAVVRRNSPAGVSSYAKSTQVGVGVSRNTLGETVSALIEVDDVSVLGRNTPAPIRVIMPRDGAQEAFVNWCNNDPQCSSQSILSLYFTYVRDSAIFGSTSDFEQVVREAFSHDDLNPKPVSGILEVQFGFKAEDAALCDDEPNCAFDLTIPVMLAGTNGVPSFDGRSLACVRLSNDDASGGYAAEVVERDVQYDGQSSTATCRTQLLGKHMLVSYNAAPETPSPFPPPLPPSQPSNIGGGDPPTSLCTSKDARAEARLVFDLDFESLDKAEFEQKLQTSLQKNLLRKFPTFFSFSGADQCPGFVAIGLSPGSVIADISIELGSGKSAQDAQELQSDLKSLSSTDVRSLLEDEDLKNSVADSGFVDTDENPLEQEDDDSSRLSLHVSTITVIIPVLFHLGVQVFG